MVSRDKWEGEGTGQSGSKDPLHECAFNALTHPLLESTFHMYSINFVKQESDTLKAGLWNAWSDSMNNSIFYSVPFFSQVLCIKNDSFENEVSREDQSKQKKKLVLK